MLNLPFILFSLTYLAAIGFYNPMGVLPGSMIKMLFCAFSLLAVVWGAFYGRKLRGIYYPRAFYWAIVLSMSFSVFMASAFHDQPLKTSIIVTMPFVFSYMLFWTMMMLDVPKEQVIRFCLFLSLIAIPLYFANAATFPNFMFGGMTEKGEDLSRGILRVPVFSLNIIAMMVFYAINQVILKKKPLMWTILGCLFAFMIFMSVWRQYIVIVYALSVIFIFLNSSMLKRLILILFLGVIAGAVTQIPAVKAMIELSEDQSDANDRDEDIRIYDYKYFGNESQTNDVTRVFGNGAPSLGNSRWGIMMENEWDELGTFPPDTGWAGYYWYYGAIAVLSVFILFLISAIRKKRPDQQYLTYTFIMYLLIEIASGAILRYDETVCIAIALYLLYGAGNSNSELIPEATPSVRKRKLSLTDYHNS